MALDLYHTQTYRVGQCFRGIVQDAAFSRAFSENYIQNNQ